MAATLAHKIAHISCGGIAGRCAERGDVSEFSLFNVKVEH